MENVIKELLHSYQEESAAAIKELHNKEMRADRLRQLEDDLVEAKHAFTMLARFFIHMGIPFEGIKEAVDNVVESYKQDNYYREVPHRRSDSEKISLFARALIDEALKYEVIRDFIAEQSPLINCTEINDHQRAWFRTYSLLIPNGMRKVIVQNDLEICVYGFRLADLKPEQ